MAASPGSAMAMMNGQDDCAGTETPSEDDEPAAMLSCGLACTAFPAAEPMVSDAVAPHDAEIAMADHQLLNGIWPEGETPPPRMTPEI